MARSMTPPMTPRMTRRTLIGAARGGLATAGIVAAACGGQAAQSPAPAAGGVAPAKIAFFIYGFTKRQQDLFDSVVKDAFEKEYPGFTMDYTAGGGLAKLVTLTSSGEAPDVTWWGDPESWANGILRKLNDFVARDKIDTRVFPQNAYKSWCVVRDAIISLPVQCGGNWPVLPYNKEMFARAGVPEPPARWGDPKWNWDAFVDACRRIQSSLAKDTSGGKKWAVGFPLGGDYYAQAHPYFWKTSWVSADWKQATPDSPSMVESIKACADLVLRVQGAPRPGEMTGNNQTNFVNGNVAMMQGAAAFLAPVAEAVANGAPFSLGALPTMKQTASSMAVDGLSLLKEGKHPDAGWLMTRWLISNPRWAIARGTPPARADFFDAWAKDYLGAIASSLRLEVYREAYAYALAIDPVNLQPRTAEIKQSVLTPALNQVFKGERDAAEALTSIKQPLQAMLQPVG